MNSREWSMGPESIVKFIEPDCREMIACRSPDMEQFGAQEAQKEHTRNGKTDVKKKDTKTYYVYAPMAEQIMHFLAS